MTETNYESPSENEGLLFDLRQRYAKLVGDHLELVAMSRLEKNYPSYFSALEDLYTIVSHKIKVNSSGKSHKEEEIEKNTEYLKLKREAIETFNKYKMEYLGEGKGNEGRWEIERCLRAIERFLYREMDEAGMFGKWEDDDGL